MQMFPYSSKWLIKLSDLTNLTHSGIPAQTWGGWKDAMSSVPWASVQSAGVAWFPTEQGEINQSGGYLPMLAGENQLVQFVLECSVLPCHAMTLPCCSACLVECRRTAWLPGEEQGCAPLAEQGSRGLWNQCSVLLWKAAHIGKQSPPGDSFTVRSWFGLTFNH